MGKMRALIATKIAASKAIARADTQARSLAAAALKVSHSLTKMFMDGTPSTVNVPHQQQGADERCRPEYSGDARDGARPIAIDDLTGDAKKGRLGDGVIQQMEHGGKSSKRPTDAEAKHQDAHVLDTRVGQESLNILLLCHERDHKGQREQAEEDQDSSWKLGPDGEPSDRQRASNAIERAIEQRA
jgi:hypothetical protein